MGVKRNSIPWATKKLLEEIGDPMHYEKITDEILDRELWSSEGKTPERSVGVALALDVKKDDPIFERVDEGVYGLAK